MPKKGIRPHTWVSGSDLVDHRLYIDCQRSRAQAKFRGEVWTITEREYIDLWRKGDLYLNKGRSPEQYCLTKIDPEKDWSLDNVHIITRLQHFQTCQRLGLGTQRAKKRRLEARNV
jgi:hypothetical protein